LDLWKFAAADVAARTPKGNRRAAVFHPFTTDQTADAAPGRTGTIETLF
jgi:hypothetical protein